MLKITARGLNRNLGERVRVEREGIIGNLISESGRRKEGLILGILEKNRDSFYIKPFVTRWQENYGLVISNFEFLDEKCQLQDMDYIYLKHGSYLLRLNQE
jgi:hypothetical protein